MVLDALMFNPWCHATVAVALHPMMTVDGGVGCEPTVTVGWHPMMTDDGDVGCEPTATVVPACDPGRAMPTADAHAEADAPATTEPSTTRRRRWTPIFVVLVAAVVVLGVIVVVALRSSGQPGDAVPADGSPPLLQDAGQAEPMPLPDMTLPALGDYGPAGGRDLGELRGEPLVINFWASWCAPCVREMPALQRVSNDLDVTVIGVDYIDQNDKAERLAERLGIEYELLRDDDGEFGNAVGLVGTPTTLLVDARGTIVRRLTGELTEQQMRDAIQADLR
jgi:cytochrome c biogenesis protein CcmG/thiol:disulfide interchange protein DsbE